jgi:hypothetical protein
MLLVYFVAGEKLMRQKQADAQLKLSMAQQRLAKLKSVYPTRDQALILGGGRMRDRQYQRNLPIVAVAHS